MPAPESGPDFASTAEIHRLSHGLYQLVQDCFEEEHYDQAISLIDSIRSSSIRPTQSHIRKVFALGLCSLPAHPLASSSQLTLDHPSTADPPLQQTQKPSRSRTAHPPSSTSKSATRPSHYAISTASFLLLRLGKSWLHPAVATEKAISEQDAILARYVLACLPSHAHQSKSASTDQRAASSATRSSHHVASRNDRGSSQMQDQDGTSPLACWIRERFEPADDVWDLLSGGRTALADPRASAVRYVDEFWLGDRQRKAIVEQLEARQCRVAPGRNSSARSRAASPVPSDSGSDIESFPSAADSGEAIPLKAAASKRRKLGHTTQRSSRTTARASQASRQGGARKSFNRDSEGDGTDEDEAEAAPSLQLTEGAWRTLRVLVELWLSESTASAQARSAFIEQFPPSAHRRRLLSSPWRNQAQSGALEAGKGSSEVAKALDIAFSFPFMIATTWWRDDPGAVHNPVGRRHGRDDDDWDQRRRVLELEVDKARVGRLEAASSLLALLFAHGKRNLLDQAAVVRGSAIRLAHLDLDHVSRLTVKLQRVEPDVLALVLLSHLNLIADPANGGDDGSESRRRTSATEVDKAEAEAIDIEPSHGAKVRVRPTYPQQVTSSARYKSTFRRLSREDRWVSAASAWMTDPGHAALGEYLLAFVPLEKGQGLNWPFYREMLPRATPRKAARDRPTPSVIAATYRIAALLRLHTIREHVRTIHIKWFILLCLYEMHQQTRSEAEDAPGRAGDRGHTGNLEEPAVVRAIKTCSGSLEAALTKELEEMQRCIDAMRDYEEDKVGDSPTSRPERMHTRGQTSTKAESGDNADAMQIAARPQDEFLDVGATAARCSEELERVRGVLVALRSLRCSGPVGD